MTVHKSLVPKGISPRAGKFIPAKELTKNERSGMKVRFQRKSRFRRIEQQDVKKVHYEDVVKSADPNFNHKAAREAFDLVMKMDDDEAEVFVNLVASNVTEDLINKNLRELQTTLDRVVSKRVERVKKAALKAAVTGGPDAVEFAKALAEISKEVKPVWSESKVNRDPTSGRFRVKISHSQNKPIHQSTAASMGIQGMNSKTYQALSPKQKAEYQDEYRQLANFLSAVQQSGDPGNTDILMHFQDKEGGRTWTEKQQGTKINRDLLYNADHRLIGVEARPNTLSAGGAAFGLMGALGNQPESGQTAWSEGINRFDAKSGKGSSTQFLDDWNAEVSGRNANDQLYGRLSTGSQLVGQFAPPGGKVQLAARFSQFVGDHGSEAEQVFGPHARKTAYRYRGTSKTPDKDAVDRYNTTVKSAKMRNQVGDRALAPTQLAAQRIMAERRTPDLEEVNGGVGELANWLMKDSSAKPKPGLYNLQLASGNTPPSEGFLIDKNGNIVDQAIGYGDDHYLPFNLKKLKTLRGGQYVRTRSVGGLTTEDIYTGLMAGAQRVTVVSRSGTFTVEFEPDFKGGRRYNDKALRMTKRYASILDAVQSQQVDRKSINPEIRTAIKDEVLEEYRGFGNPKEISTEIERRVQEFKENPELSENDERLARLIATHRAQGQGKDADDFMAQAMSDIAEEKEYKFRLNGNGYGAAQDALHEQFPYYIKSKWTPLRDNDRFETETDRGYVEPGKNRPTYAAAGLFGNAAKNPVIVGSRGKFSAAEADFQGRGRGGSPAKDVPPTPGLSPTGEKKDEVRAKIAEIKQGVAYASAASALQAKVKGLGIQNQSDEDLAAQNLSPEDLKKPASQKMFDAYVQRLQDSKIPLGEELVAYKRAAGHFGQEGYSSDRAGVWGQKPFKFEGAAYSGDEKARVAELAKIDKNAHGGIVHDKQLSAMNDAELQSEHSALAMMRSYLDAGRAEEIPIDQRKELLESLGVKGGPALYRLLEKPERIDKQLEYVQRVRSLNSGVADAKRNPDIVVPPKTEAEANQSGPKAAIRLIMDQIEQAAVFYGDKGEDHKVDLLNEAAQDLHDQMSRVKSPSDARELQDKHKAAMNIVMQYYRDAKQEEKNW